MLDSYRDEQPTVEVSGGMSEGHVELSNIQFAQELVTLGKFAVAVNKILKGETNQDPIATINKFIEFRDAAKYHIADRCKGMSTYDVIAFLSNAGYSDSRIGDVYPLAFPNLDADGIKKLEAIFTISDQDLVAKITELTQ